MRQAMEAEVADHFLKFPEDVLFAPDFIINELMSTDAMEEIVFRNEGMKTEPWSITDSLMCWSCFRNFDDINTFGAHLFINSSCFHILTEQYWSKSPGERQICGICYTEMLDESMLKTHCFESEHCRKAFINCLSRMINVDSVLTSKSVGTRETPLVWNIDFKQNSNYIDCTTLHISEMGKKEPTSPALTEAKDNFLDCYKPFKEVKRSPSMMSEVIGKVENIPAEPHNCLPSVNIEQPFVTVQGVSTEREFRPYATSTPDITMTHNYCNTEQKPLPLKYLKNIDISQYGDKQFRTARNKEKHLARSVKAQSLGKPPGMLSCLCCGFICASHEEKQNHLITSRECQLFLKNSFLDGKFLSDIPICDNYTLNKNMCPFCLFTVDDGQIISHILHVMKCRNKLEEAISRYHTPSSKFPTPRHEPKQTAQFTPQCEPEQIAQFTCNVCKCKYKTIRSLRAHKTLKHNDCLKNFQHKKERQRCSDPEHLFCFFCKKFLTSQADIDCHQCRPTRLLSRYWYRKAVWAESEYECIACSEKFFYRKGDLEKHMYQHDKKKSQLFKFLPCSSNQTDMLQVPCPDITDETSPDLCHNNRHETTLETASDRSSVEVSLDALEYEETESNNISPESNKNIISEPCGLNKPSGNFVCECCSTEFCLPDLFIAHVMMNSNCLFYYENQENTPPVIVSFCFKCKRNFRSDGEFISHQCIGLVSVIYKCALCPKMFHNLNSLRKHENKKHKVSMESENVETVETCSDSESFADETPVYRCTPCQSTFHNSSHFVEHISQVHEKEIVLQ